MYVLEVIPLSRTAPTAPLSYRSATKLNPGTIVSIPLRKKIVSGLVVECIPVQEAKYRLKTAMFSLSKSTDLKQGELPKELITAAKDVAEYHATTVGAVLAALLVPTLLEIKPFTLSKGLGAGVEKIEAPFLKRLDSYQNYISDTYTVLLVVPTQVEADDWSLRLKKYSPLVLSGKLTGERREAALTRARSSDDIPRIIIATPGFVWVPIPNLCRIVIERASAGSYSLPKRPYLDLRYALAALARERAIPLTYGDYPLPLEYRDDPNSPLTKIIGSIEVIDVRTPKTEKAKAGQTNTKPTWKAVPDTFITQIKETLSTGGRVAVLAARRGYAPTVVCGDCGTAVADEHGRALSLATEKGVRVFRSSDGTVSQGADVFCKNCGGWNLNPLGIGIERVEEELRLAFPDTLLVRISEESKRVASLKKVRAEIDTAGTIIIGTEMMLPWISPDMPVDLGIIASADSLLALPFWRSRERFVRIGLMLAERSGRTLVATRRPDDTSFSVLRTDSDLTTECDSFWKEETGLRKILHYPPFGTLIIFHIEGSALRIAEARDMIKTACLPFIPHELPDRGIGPNTFKSSLVLQLDKDSWPNLELSDRIARLSPQIRVHLNSEMLW